MTKHAFAHPDEYLNNFAFKVHDKKTGKTTHHLDFEQAAAHHGFDPTDVGSVLEYSGGYQDHRWDIDAIPVVESRRRSQRQ